MNYDQKTKKELITEIEQLQQKCDSLKVILEKDITEREKTEKALYESEDRFRKIVEQAPIAMAVVSMDGTIEFINDKAVKVFGYNHEDIPNMESWWIRAYPDEAYRKEAIDDWMGRIQIALANGKDIIGNEYLVACKDGTIKTTFIFGAPVSGKIFVLFDDITERKKAEEALRESEERFSKAFNTSPYAYVIADLEDGSIIEVNEAFTNITGFTREEALINSTINLNLWVNQEDRHRFVETLHQGKRVLQEEAQMRLKNGNFITGLFSAQVIQLGKRFCILSILEDITKRKLAEEAHRKSEERYRRLIETTDTGYVIIDTSGIVIDANQEYAHLSGHDKIDEILGRSVIEWTAPDEIEKNKDAVIICMKNGYIRNLEITYVDENGKRKPVEINATLIEMEGKQQILGLCRDITARKLAEEKLKQALERLDLATNAAYLGIWDWDIVKNELIWDNRMYELYGTSRENFTGTFEAWLNLIHPEDRCTNEEIYKQTLRGEKEYNTGFRVIWPDGTVHHLRAYGLVMRDLNGKPIRMIGINYDITEHKLAEEKQKQMSSLLRATLESTADGILVVELSGKVSGFNKKFGELWHIPQDLLDTGDDDKLLSFILDQIEDPDKFLSKVKELYSQPNQESLDIIEFKDGKIFERYSLPQRIDDKIVGRVWSFRDITIRRQAELSLKEKNKEIETQNEEFIQLNQELKQTNFELIKSKEEAEESELKYKLLYNNTPVMMHSSNLEGKLVSVNDYWLHIMGYELDEVIGTKSSEFLTEQSQKLYRDKIDDFIKTGSLNNLEAQAIKKDGEIIDLLISSKILYNNDGKPVLTMTNLVVITEKKQSERALQQSNDELNLFNQKYLNAKEKAEESDRLKTAFLQNMSHEIRTPMNAIMGFSSLLVKNYNDKPKLEKFSEIINQRCSDLLDIINDILDISKIESGQLPLNYEDCDLNELFTELVTFFKEHQKRTNKQHINFKLKAFDNPIQNIIQTDKVKLKQIFINLIGNAFKFTDAGKIEGGCKPDENKNLVFYVSDTGIGIPNDKHDKVFERFAQLGHAKNKVFSGTGLGLPIVKGLVGLLGGKIWLESELDKGTTFYFSLPYKPPQSKTQEPASNPEIQEQNFTGKTILVVEDDLYNLAYIKEIFSHSGLNIIHTEYGKEALQIVENQTLDLVLLDIRLPDFNGYEVSSMMKQLKPDLKIIAQTAYAADEDRQKAIAAGCIDYISKPLKHNLLLSMINKYLKI